MDVFRPPEGCYARAPGLARQYDRALNRTVRLILECEYAEMKLARWQRRLEQLRAKLRHASAEMDVLAFVYELGETEGNTIELRKP